MNPKMKPEEALFLFNNMEFAEKYQGKDEYTEVTLVIKQALEKQIPMKPFLLPLGMQTVTGEIVSSVMCRICKKPFLNDAKIKHCLFCGQLLDWSDTE